jgi:hypothetical protein
LVAIRTSILAPTAMLLVLAAAGANRRLAAMIAESALVA